MIMSQDFPRTKADNQTVIISLSRAVLPFQDRPSGHCEPYVIRMDSVFVVLGQMSCFPFERFLKDVDA